MFTRVASSPQGQRSHEDNWASTFVISLQAVIVATLTLALFWATLIDMAHDWWTVPALSQGMLLPPMAAWVAWLNRSETLSYPALPDARGLIFVAAACAMYILGNVASEFFISRSSFVVLLAGIVWSFWGIQRFRTLIFPFLLLATMIPLPAMVYNSLAAPLQLLASDAATRAAQFCGVSVFRDGNVIHLAGTSLGVAEACSGLNSLSALLAGSLLIGYLVCNRVLARSVLFVASVPLAIGVNMVRVAGTALIADYNQELAMGFYHSFSGWLVFVCGAGLLYLLARFLHAVMD